MNARSDRFWQFGPRAATLFVAYLLVLQGMAVGVASGARPISAGLFQDSICLTKSIPSGGNPAAPAAPGHRSDVCCVFHCSGLAFGAPPAFVGAPAPVRAYADLSPAADLSGLPATTATPPLGSRAPPPVVL